MRFSLKAECWFYTFLWVMYYLQGVLYPSASFFAKVALGLVLVMSLYRSISFFSLGLSRYYKAAMWLVVMFFVYGFFHLFESPAIMRSEFESFPVTQYYYLKDSMCSLLPLFAYGFYCRRGIINDNNITKFIALFFFLAVINFFSYSRMLLSVTALNVDSGFSLVNNMGYRFIPLMPLVYFMRKYRNLYLLTCYLFTVLCLKRGALIVGSIFVFVYMLNTIILDRRRGSKHTKIVVLIVFFVAFVFLYDYIRQNEILFGRINAMLEGDSSGREDYYVIAFNYLFKDLDVFRFLFGGGANTSIRIIGNYAHNDWLEIGMNNGLLGLSIYVSFLFAGLFTWKQLKRKNQKDESFAFGMYILAFFLMSLFSMAVTEIGPVYSIGIGFCMYHPSKKQYT